MSLLLLSVMITAFEAELFLDECLESVCCADYDNLQVVLVNDGSTDLTAEICDRWAAIDPRIDLHHREHGGS